MAGTFCGLAVLLFFNLAVILNFEDKKVGLWHFYICFAKWKETITNQHGMNFLSWLIYIENNTHFFSWDERCYIRPKSVITWQKKPSDNQTNMASCISSIEMCQVHIRNINAQAYHVYSNPKGCYMQENH